MRDSDREIEGELIVDTELERVCVSKTEEDRQVQLP